MTKQKVTKRIIEVNQDTLTYSKGRHGFIKTSGVEMILFSDDKTIMLSPLTSKGKPCVSCNIEVNRKSLPDIIRALQTFC